MSADDQRNQISLFGDLLAPPVEKPAPGQPKAKQAAPPASTPLPAEERKQTTAGAVIMPVPERPEPVAIVPVAKKKAAAPKSAAASSPVKIVASRQTEKAARSKSGSAPAAQSRSGLVPDGDVRLTANIRQDLHLRLKIAAATRRTTVGELIEEFVEKHL